MRAPDREIWKGLAAGLAAGLAGTWAMTQVQVLMGRWTESRREGEPYHPQHSAARGTQEGGRRGRESGAGRDATVRAAEAVSRHLLGRELTRREERLASPLMHYGFGTMTGGLYGALAELAPEVTRGAGAPFGIAVWVAADEVAIPAFGLSDPPLENPPSVHLRALAAHLVYGLTTEGVRRLLRNS